MINPDFVVKSLQNPRVKQAVRLRKRSVREEEKAVIIEGYRELQSAVDNQIWPKTLFYCPDLFLGENELGLIARCQGQGTTTIECTERVFQKIAYRDRPEGLLALSHQVTIRLVDLELTDNPFLIVAVGIEKPGNLGSILRSADAAGADAVIVCDGRTDIHNPNTVRASIGTLFCLPVAVAESEEAICWLRGQGIRVVATTPDSNTDYFDLDLTRPLAITVGTEQIGLSQEWMNGADQKARIPMFGQADSLNVANAAAVLLYEAMRQRRGLPSPKAQKVST